VTVVVPFLGDAADAARVSEQLEGLERLPGDELILVDNSPAPVATAGGAVRVVRAGARASSYYARNEGAKAANNDWVLFVDSDCLLPATLLADYFDGEPADACGVIAGELEAAPGQTAFTAQYERDRGHLEVAQHMDWGPGPAGITANMLVRREAWAGVGGFCEVRSGADMEFCWRAGAAGWTVEYRPQARVQHLHTERLRTMLRKARRYGPGQAWLNRRFPGTSPPPPVARQVGRAIAGTLVWTLTFRFRRAAYKALDGLWSVAYGWGYRFGDNEAAAMSPLDPAAADQVRNGA
jgi:GT2 family glycosyltransferase